MELQHVAQMLLQIQTKQSQNKTTTKVTTTVQADSGSREAAGYGATIHRPNAPAYTPPGENLYPNINAKTDDDDSRAAAGFGETKRR